MKTLKGLLSGILALALAAGLCPAANAAWDVTKVYSVGAAEAGRYSAPVIADLEGDGKAEILCEGFDTLAVDAATGKQKWLVRPPEHDGAWSTPVVTDVDGDGQLDVVSTRYHTVYVWDCYGRIKPGWPQVLDTEYAIRSFRVGDVNGDGKQEIVCAVGVYLGNSLWVLDCEGRILPGWPYYAVGGLGLYGKGLSLGDVNGDGKPDILGAMDCTWAEALDAAGKPIPGAGSQVWSVSTDGVEFGHAGSAFCDVDGDGTGEFLAVGVRTDYRDNDPTVPGGYWLYSADMSLVILGADGDYYRNEALGFDWTEPGHGVGGRLTESTDSSAAWNFAVPVCADLNRDGLMEVLYNSFDGRVYCFSLDKTRRYYTLPGTTETVAENPTTPVVYDLNGDGRPEILFASWTNDRSLATEPSAGPGALYILDSQMNLLSRTPLPVGTRGSPAAADVDGDGVPEIALNINGSVNLYRLQPGEKVLGNVAGFTDVYEDDAFAGAVVWAKEQAITTGTTETTFSPFSTVTRSQAVTFLWRAMGKPRPISTQNPFTDVKESDYFYEAVLWAVENGITLGTSETAFTPYQTCSTAHILTFLYRTLHPGKDGWYQEAADWAASHGLLRGVPLKIAPGVDCPRADVVTFLFRELAR